MSSDLGFGQVLPALGLSKPAPAILWMKDRFLTAEQSNCAVVSNVFHSHLPNQLA